MAHCSTSESQWLQYFKFLEIQHVPLRMVFANPVTYAVPNNRIMYLLLGVALTGGTEGTIAGGMGDGTNVPRTANVLDNFTYILLDGSETDNAILFRCATGRGPDGNDGNDVIGDMYHNNVLLTDQMCNGFVIAQGVGNTFRFPGIYQARVCGILTTSTEGVYTCTLTNSSMMDQSVSIGAYLSTRSESLYNI